VQEEEEASRLGRQEEEVQEEEEEEGEEDILGSSDSGLSKGSGTSMIRGAAGLLAMTAVLALPAIASASPISQTFDTGNQGWGVSQNSGQIVDAGPTDWIGSGGNPGGHLTATDTGADSGCAPAGPGSPCNILYFESPPLVVGGLAGNYGGTASYDLRSSVSPGFASELIIGSTSKGALLSGVVPETAGTTYHHLSIPLIESSAWQFCTTSCVPASQAQFKALLAVADFISIDADVAPSDTGETYDLDNVTLTDGPPAPIKKKKKCKKRKKAKRRAAVAGKKCKKKPKKRASVTSPRTENREF
jgi:hypothetical protein